MLPRTGDLLVRKYRLGEELGRGAMGIVYDAHHETLDQRVAIKILRSDALDEVAAIRRFEREARIVAKLDSPHVVKVIDVDRTEEGVPYLVMERLEGRDLSAEVEARGEAPIPVPEAVGWMMQVCEAMGVAHDAGVVHRDLKLSNVFLTGDGTVKVLDFGVAVLRNADPGRSTTMTVAGTPRYMAPEQLLGEPPDPSSDIWAIGVMLYRMLGGRFPYDAPTMAGQMLAMMEGCPSLDAIAPRVPKELGEIVGRALSQGLEQRWPSARALSSALAPFRETEAPRTSERPSPQVDPPPPLAAANVRPTRRRLPRAAVSFALVIAGAALVALGARVLTRPTDPAISTAPTTTPEAVVISVAPPPPAPPAAPSAVPDRVASAMPSLAPPPRVPRTATVAASASAPAPRPAASASGSPDDGFPPHL